MWTLCLEVQGTLETMHRKLRVVMGKTEGIWTTEVILGPLQQPGLTRVTVRGPQRQALPDALNTGTDVVHLSLVNFLYPSPPGLLDLVVMMTDHLQAKTSQTLHFLP